MVRFGEYRSIIPHLWNGAEQLIIAGVSIATWLKAAACKFVVSSLELGQKDLVVVVRVEQGTDVAGKLVKPGQPHPLLTSGSVHSLAVFINFLMV